MAFENMNGGERLITIPAQSITVGGVGISSPDLEVGKGFGLVVLIIDGQPPVMLDVDKADILVQAIKSAQAKIKGGR
jgi:hypothetical protein